MKSFNSIMIFLVLILIGTEVSKCELKNLKNNNLGHDGPQGGNQDKKEPHWEKYIGIYCKDLTFCNTNSGQTCFANKCLVTMYGKCNTNKDCLNTNQSRPYLVCQDKPSPEDPKGKVCLANKGAPTTPKT